MNFKHISIMPKEVLEAFSKLDRGSLIVDGTLGKGGHSKLLLEKGFKVIGIDRDSEAIKETRKNLQNENIKIFHNNFANIKEVLKNAGVKKISGILLDLGVSTHQLEKNERGFGFEGQLDMRMNQNQKTTAQNFLNESSEEEISKTLKRYGEKVFYKEIAKSIVQFREREKIETGKQLLEIIEGSLPEKFRKTRKHHWATPTFRAIRIAVNQDFENLQKFLDEFKDCLEIGGILCIITFHSLEEKIVKTKLKLLKKRGIRLVTKKGIEATQSEILKNPKAKRAKIWIAEKK